MEKKHNGLILGCFLAYYVILVVERIYSLFATVATEGIRFMFNTSMFSLYVYGVTCASLGVFLILFLIVLGKVLSNGVEGNVKGLIITACALLVSGMVHTEHSLFPVQLVAYVFLLLAILFRYFDIRNQISMSLTHIIISFLYFTAFSMAIPVVYRTNSGNTNLPWYVVEAIGSLALIFVFMIMMRLHFSDKFKAVYSPVFLIIMLVVNAFVLLLAIEDPKDINWFVAISSVIALVMFIVNKATSPKVAK